MSGIDSEDGRKSVEIQEYEYFLCLAEMELSGLKMY